MNDTLLRKKNQVTLPAEIVEAAGLTIKDRIDWRFEAGEIRGLRAGDSIESILGNTAVT